DPRSAPSPCTRLGSRRGPRFRRYDRSASWIVDLHGWLHLRGGPEWSVVSGPGGRYGLPIGPQADLHVAARGVGVRAHLVCSGHNGDRTLRVAYSWEGDIEPYGHVEPAVLGRDQADFRLDGNCPKIKSFSAPDDAKCSLEARGIAHGEELLGVGAAAVAP